MKKIILVDASPRVNGNSEVITDTLENKLKDRAEVTVFKMREKSTHPCLACAACQKSGRVMCAQKDDITELLPLMDACDGIVLATPIYLWQVSAQAKTFIDRIYPFYKPGAKANSNTSKFGKKAAIIFSFWGSDVDIMKKYADYTMAHSFNFVGAEEFRTLIFNGIGGRGQVAKREDYMSMLDELAEWLA